MFLLLSEFLDRYKLPLITKVFDIHIERLFEILFMCKQEMIAPIKWLGLL